MSQLTIKERVDALLTEAKIDPATASPELRIKTAHLIYEADRKAASNTAEGRKRPSKISYVRIGDDLNVRAYPKTPNQQLAAWDLACLLMEEGKAYARDDRRMEQLFEEKAAELELTAFVDKYGNPTKVRPWEAFIYYSDFRLEGYANYQQRRIVRRNG